MALLHRSFTHFLTGVCAIIGGVFTGEISVFLGRMKECRLHKPTFTACFYCGGNIYMLSAHLVQEKSVKSSQTISSLNA